MLGPSAKGVQRMDCVSEVREGNFKVVGDKLPHKFLWEKTLKLPLFLHLSFFYTVMPHVLWKKYWKWVKKSFILVFKKFVSKETLRHCLFIQILGWILWIYSQWVFTPVWGGLLKKPVTNYLKASSVYFSPLPTFWFE